MRHVMVDIETLGSVPGSVILSIGAVEFTCPELDSSTPTAFVEKPFFRSIEIFSSLMEGFTIDPKTVEWWKEQSSAAQDDAQPSKGRVSVQVALHDFYGYLKPAKNSEACVWAKGPDFDLTILLAAYRITGWDNPPWSFRNARDVRTIYWLAGGGKEPPPRVEHSALNDATSQAWGVIDALARLKVNP